jgi:hypothetical protein
MKLYSELFRDLCIGLLASCLCWSLVALTGSTRNLIGSANRLVWNASAVVEQTRPDVVATAAAVRGIAEKGNDTMVQVNGTMANVNVIAGKAAQPEGKMGTVKKFLSIGGLVLRILI